jgi:hypothetical protein
MDVRLPRAQAGHDDSRPSRRRNPLTTGSTVTRRRSPQLAADPAQAQTLE